MRAKTSETIAEARRILALAWPVMLTSFNWTLMQLIDVVIVGQAGTAQLGALAASRAITYITIVTGLAGLSGVLVFAARASGAGDLRATGDQLRAGIACGLLTGLACMAVLLACGRTLIAAIGVAPALVGPGGAVLGAMAFAYPGQFTMAAAAYFLEGISRPRRVMAVNLALLPANALLAWAWTDGRLGLPALGAVGAARATATVSLLGAIGMLASVWLLPDAAARGIREVTRGAWRRTLAGVPPLLRFGAVPAISSGLELAGFSWLIALSTRLGEAAAGAFQAIFSLHNFVFALGLGLGSATGVRVGNAVGAGTPGEALPRTRIAAGLTVALLGAIACAYALAARWIVRPFSPDPEVLALAAPMLVLLAPFMLFDGLQVVFVYALRSLGDQVVAGLNGIVAFFLCCGALGWALVRAGAGPSGLVIAAGTGMVAATLLNGARLWWLFARAPSRSSG